MKMNQKEVVVILPYVNNKVLLQLRDMKEGIAFPGCWGFFGGSIDDGETPEDAAIRELFEEIGYKPAVMYNMGVERVPELEDITLHAYYCPLMIPLAQIILREGLDLGFFSLQEIMEKVLFSNKMGKLFPVIDTPHLFNTIKKLFNHIKIT